MKITAKADQVIANPSDPDPWNHVLRIQIGNHDIQFRLAEWQYKLLQKSGVDIKELIRIMANRINND